MSAGAAQRRATAGREQRADGERSPTARWLEAFAAASAERAGEPAWLGAARKAALARFDELGFPDRRHEEWKYTNAARIAAVPWQAAPAVQLGAGDVAALDLPFGEDPCLVFVNGRLDASLSRRGSLPAGVTLAGFRELLGRDPGSLEPVAALPAALEDRAFAALAVAFAADGAFVRVAAGIASEPPLWVVFVSAPGAAEPVAAHPRLVALAEPGSRLSLVEVHATLGAGAQLSNALAELRVGENASIEHVRIQIEGPDAVHLGQLAASVARDARLASRAFLLGARTARLDAVAALVAPGAECALDGLYVAAGAQHVDCRTTIDHQAPHGSSSELFKGVLAGRARGVFNGKVVVRADAQKTNARQKNENLLLSSHAEVDSKPQLEILADDVRCSHGSTIGQLDEDALFYLRARGLGEPAARALLVRAFCGEITEALPGERLRGRVEAEVRARLAEAGPAGPGPPGHQEPT